MNSLSRKIMNKTERPIKVMQFGEGNFLRGFVDYMIDIANESGYFNGDIILVKPIEHGSIESLLQQDCLYTVSLRGLAEGEKKIESRVITSVADAVDAYSEYERYAALAKSEELRFVVSNTTEAGIVYDEKDSIDLCPPRSYPGKLVKFLYERYQYFEGGRDKGLIILPVELIDNNGSVLKDTAMKLARSWKLEEGFVEWLQQACVFCSTLVDRIVTGYPKDEAEGLWKEYGYIDQHIVTGEPFALWVIEGDQSVEKELPLSKAGLPVIFTENHKPYKQRKVRILNGAHTSFSLASYLAGNDYVLESMQDQDIHSFMRKTIYEEIIPTLSLTKEELCSFADAVTERFLNPFIKHALLSISLNSVSKWKARCLPSLLDYEKKFSKLPSHLTFSLAALMEFYSGKEIKADALIGYREGVEYQIKDDKEVLEFFAEKSGADIRSFTESFLSNVKFWDQDLTMLPSLTEQIVKYLTDIRTNGIREAIKRCNEE